MATSTFTQLLRALSVSVFLSVSPSLSLCLCLSVCLSVSLPLCYFTPKETISTIRDREPRAATSTFTQLLSSEGAAIHRLDIYTYFPIGCSISNPLLLTAARLWRGAAGLPVGDGGQPPCCHFSLQRLLKQLRHVQSAVTVPRWGCRTPRTWTG